MQPAASLKTKTADMSGLLLMDSAKFRIRTIEDADMLTRFLAPAFRDPDRIVTGIYALLLNAVEHGCLGIGHDLKTQLITARTWQAEVSRRQSLPENRKKSAELVIARRNEGIFIIISDPGPGFDWKSWLSLDPARAGDTTGRGIAEAKNLSFDSLSYNNLGNQVTALSRNAPQMAW